MKSVPIYRSVQLSLFEAVWKLLAKPPLLGGYLSNVAVRSCSRFTGCPAELSFLPALSICPLEAGTTSSRKRAIGGER